jgi:hypothetical protein
MRSGGGLALRPRDRLLDFPVTHMRESDLDIPDAASLSHETLNLVVRWFAIPDHPWYLTGDMAAVRIAMTVGAAGKQEGQLFRVADCKRNAANGGDELQARVLGTILPKLSVGVDTDKAKPLLANERLCSPGVKLHGSGFIVTPERARQLGLGAVAGLGRHIRPYCHGKDLTGRPRGVMVIDLFGLSEQDVRERYPAVYQHVLQNVKPERDAKKWWLFGKPRSELRPALSLLPRYIATVETAKHRVFQFLDASTLADNMLVVIALADAFFLGVLSSRVHLTWALAAGGRLGVGNDPRYQKSRCFDPFPFPTATEAQKQVIGDLAEELDVLRKRVLAEHPDLTLTGSYNILEKLKGGEALSKKERDIHERGLVSLIKHLHEEIDRAVFAAYGWPETLEDEEILARLVALNQERRAEEARGQVRWLRPKYQAPEDVRIVAKDKQAELDIAAAPMAEPEAARARLPAALLERITSIRAVLASQEKPLHADEIARQFPRARRDAVQDVLNALVALGLARRIDGNRYTP